MSRTKRLFWKIFLSVFANVPYETLILEGLFVRFCECLVRNARFGRFPSPFLRMSRMKHSFWKTSLSVFANVSYEKLIYITCSSHHMFSLISLLVPHITSSSTSYVHSLFCYLLTSSSLFYILNIYIFSFLALGPPVV